MSGARQFYSVHGGTAYRSGDPLEGSSHGGRRRLSSLLKPSSTAVNLSEMAPHDLSVHDAGARRAPLCVPAMLGTVLQTC